MIAAKIRLRKKHIFCISPSTINTCGAINTVGFGFVWGFYFFISLHKVLFQVCFDKTGTLTEDGLDFYCVRPLRQEEDGGCPGFDIELKSFSASEMSHYGEFVKAISTCHSLTRYIIGSFTFKTD